MQLAVEMEKSSSMMYVKAYKNLLVISCLLRRSSKVALGEDLSNQETLSFKFLKLQALLS